MEEKDKKLYSNFDYDSALNVQKGVHQSSQINNFYLQKLRSQSHIEPSAQQLVQGILSADRTSLSRAITLLESTLPQHAALAQQVVQQCLPHSGRSVRLGVTGVPGAGKSTFIESLGSLLVAQGHRVAVLAIDPSSQRSRGSILADKTRMPLLSSHPQAFVRPSPSSGSLGGVARATRESIFLCEAAGFDTIIVETVGVGQSEVEAHSMVDCFLLLQPPHLGDELQGIKRGIMELADLVVINKSDIDSSAAQVAAQHFRNALQLYPLPPSRVPVQVSICSSLLGQGIQQVWQLVQAYVDAVRQSGFFLHNRRQQNIQLLHHSLQQQLLQRFSATPGLSQALQSASDDILQNKRSPYAAAEALIQRFFSSFPIS